MDEEPSPRTCPKCGGSWFALNVRRRGRAAMDELKGKLGGLGVDVDVKASPATEWSARLTHRETGHEAVVAANQHSGIVWLESDSELRFSVNAQTDVDVCALTVKLVEFWADKVWRVAEREA